MKNDDIFPQMKKLHEIFEYITDERVNVFSVLLKTSVLETGRRFVRKLSH